MADNHNSQGDDDDDGFRDSFDEEEEPQVHIAKRTDANAVEPPENLLHPPTNFHHEFDELSKEEIKIELAD